MSSAAMALYGVGNTQFNPSTLNKWLISNGGYASGNLFVWGSVNRFGMNFKGFVNNGDVKKNLDAGYVVILNVRGGGHWVLATGYSGDTINVKDPGYDKSSYALSEVVNGNTGVYTVTKMPNFINNWFISVSDFFGPIFGKKEPEMPPNKVVHSTGNIRQQ